MSVEVRTLEYVHERGERMRPQLRVKGSSGGGARDGKGNGEDERMPSGLTIRVHEKVLRKPTKL